MIGPFARTPAARRQALLADGATIELTVRRSARARRILLQVAPVDGAVELVLPHRAALAEALDFVTAKTRWIRDKQAEALGRIPFADGVSLPYLGREIRIRRTDGSGAWPRLASNVLVVPGRAEELPGRVLRWLRRAAAEDIAPRVADKASRLGRAHGRITLRDARTRWGSCSPTGNLSFSWRLVLAPEPVLDYVVAHEVAHLAELNHSRRFWAHVANLCEAPERARAWLRANGATLHRYG